MFYQINVCVHICNVMYICMLHIYIYIYVYLVIYAIPYAHVDLPHMLEHIET